jgi:hypothetical protein
VSVVFCDIGERALSGGLLKAIADPRISTLDRWSVLFDHRLCVGAGLVSNADVIPLLPTYVPEDDPFLSGAIVTAVIPFCAAPPRSPRPCSLRSLRESASVAIRLSMNAFVPSADNSLWRRRFWRLIRRQLNLIAPQAAFDFVCELAQSDDDPFFQRAACIAMGFAPEERLDDMLELLLTARPQYVQVMTQGVAANLRSGRKPRECFKAHIEWFIQTYF